MNRDLAAAFVRVAVLCLLLAIPIAPAHALEALDGRIEAHGFFESQLRVIGDDFSGDFDLAQWHQVLNVEIEVDILPDGWGYIDLLQAYVRVEGRYDCVYTRGCGMIRGADMYGDKAKNLPKRVANGKTSTYHGAILLDSTTQRINEFLDTDGDGVEDTTRQRLVVTRHGDRIASNREVLPLSQIPGFSGLGSQSGADGYTGKAPFGNAANGKTVPAETDPDRIKFVRRWVLNSDQPDYSLPSGKPDLGGDWALEDDDPFNFVFGRFRDFRFAHRALRGGSSGGLPVAVMGPWLPKNFIFPNATLADIPNPFDATVTPELLRRAAYNGSIYSSSDYGTKYSAGGIDNDNTDTFFEEDLLKDTHQKGSVGGTGLHTILTGALLSSSDTSLVQNFWGAVRFDPDVPETNTYGREGLLYSAELDFQPTEYFGDAQVVCGFPTTCFFTNAAAYTKAIKIRGIAASTSPSRRGTAKPMRPVPIHDAGDYAVGDTRARGVYLPSRGLRKTIASGRLDPHPLNIDERARTWNRGASQDEGELKEAYIDLETWDSRLWLRLGKQNIVWGKTELFRTTDQFNPVDLALVTLGNLEETRIALWSARAVLSLYEVGPFDDVRLEFAANIDEYESNDLGACGEPFAPNPVCSASFGVLAHGMFGIGLAGVDFPESPWEDIGNLEFGGRIEWRWDRFSFAIADFYGYEDLPYLDRISTYERNVDPNTGRMRGMGDYGPCTTQPIGLRAMGAAGIPEPDPACLQAGPTRRDNLDAELVIGGVSLNTYLADASLLPLGSDDMPIPEQPGGFFANAIPGDPTFSPNNALDASPVNQQFFAAICAGTVGVSALDPASCAGTIFGSQQALPIQADLYRLAPIIGNFLTGSAQQEPGLGLPFSFGADLIAPPNGISPAEVDLVLVKLNRDPFDAEQGALFGGGRWGEWRSYDPIPPLTMYGGPNKGCVDNSLLTNSELTRPGQFDVSRPIPCHSSGSTRENLALYLTVEQQALLGCGPFFGSNCADSGIDLLTAEASVLFQSFPGFDGTANAAGGLNFRGPAVANQPRQWTTNNRKYDPVGNSAFGVRMADDGQDRIQPGTIFFRGGPVGNVVVDRTTGEQAVLPGARSPFIVTSYAAKTVAANYDHTVANASCDPSDASFVADNPNCAPNVYNSTADGCVGGPDFFTALGLPTPPGCSHTGSRHTNVFTDILGIDAGDEVGIPLHTLKHPLVTESLLTLPSFGITGLGGSDDDQYFRSEMAALSFNFLMLLTVNDGLFHSVNPYALCQELLDGDGRVDTGTCELDSAGKPIPVCSFVTPQNCGTVRGLLGLAGLTRNTVRAGGDGTFGRRTFAWQSGGEAVLGFARRNVLGFSGDFAEDFTKSNFSLEATWFNNVPRGYSESFNGVANADDYNVTLSIDRPTFVNFLNANRTFFFNTQWFFRYRDYKGAPDAWSLLGTFTILAGYFQDRLLPTVTFVYDIRSSTGAVLPQLQYRYTEAFSIVVGAQFFAGRPDMNPIAVNGLGPGGNEQGRYAYQAASDVGVSIVRHIDNFYVRLRYSF